MKAIKNRNRRNARTVGLVFIGLSILHFAVAVADTVSNGRPTAVTGFLFASSYVSAVAAHLTLSWSRSMH